MFFNTAFSIFLESVVFFVNEINFYNVDLKYIRNLSKVDDNIMSISPQREKESRPFVGIIILLNEKKYCIPLTSPKEKFLKSKSQIDFIKIFDKSKKNANGAFKLIGVLNLNNMIPIDESLVIKMNLTISKNDCHSDKAYKELLHDQLRWCRDNSDTIINRANKVYNLVTEQPKKNINLTRRCCNFKKLETVLDKYLTNLKNRDIQEGCHSENITFKRKEQYNEDIHTKKTFTLSRKQMNDNAKKVADKIISNQSDKAKKLTNDFSHKKKGSEPR